MKSESKETPKVKRQISACKIVLTSEIWVEEFFFKFLLNVKETTSSMSSTKMYSFNAVSERHNKLVYIKSKRGSSSNFSLTVDVGLA